MIQHGVLEMDSIYSMLGPEDKTILADAEKEIADAKEFVRRVNVVSTNKDANKDEGMDIDQMNILVRILNEFRSFYCVVQSFIFSKQNAINPKFGLLEALLKVGAWPEAESLISRLPTYYAVSQPMIANALQRLIHITMDPIHQK